MKKTLMLFLVIIIGLSLSSFDSKGSFSKGRVLLQQIENVQSIEARKLAFSMLRPEEKYSLWSSRLQEMIWSGEFNSKQSHAIAQLNNALSVDVFQKTSQAEIFKNVTFSKWVQESSSVLSSFQIYNIALTIGKSAVPKEQKSIATSLDFDGAESQKTCKCKVGSSFTCPRFTLSWPPSAEYGDCSKAKNETCVQTSGCGVLWDSTCDGSICSH